MSDDPKTASEAMANSGYDHRSGRLSQAAGGKPQGLATSPRDTNTGRVQETPGGPSERPGTEAEEAAKNVVRGD
jgi:hypothetical protein